MYASVTWMKVIILGISKYDLYYSYIKALEIKNNFKKSLEIEFKKFIG